LLRSLCAQNVEIERGDAMDIDEGADRDAVVLAGRPLPRAVAEALADPIVRSLMAADGIDEAALRRLLGADGRAARLRPRHSG
jgi:hypothetical protein